MSPLVHVLYILMYFLCTYDVNVVFTLARSSTSMCPNCQQTEKVIICDSSTCSFHRELQAALISIYIF